MEEGKSNLFSNQMLRPGELQPPVHSVTPPQPQEKMPVPDQEQVIVPAAAPVQNPPPEQPPVFEQNTPVQSSASSSEQQAQIEAAVIYPNAIPVQSYDQNLAGMMMKKTANTDPSVPPYSTNPNLKNLRTYESDVAEIMAKKRTSVATIAIAETKKVEQDKNESANSPAEEPSHVIRNLLLTLASLLLAGGGIAGAYYLYTISPLGQSRPTTPVVAPKQEMLPGIISADSQVKISIDDNKANAIIDKFKTEISKPQKSGTIKEIVPVVSKDGSVTKITASELIDIFEIRAPSIAIRSITGPYMTGVYANSDGTNEFFVIASNNFFQNVFAGMLEWERLMPDDLKSFLTDNPSVSIANASGTPVLSTSTPAFSVIRGQFTDKLVRNKDVREFVTSEGQTLFLYSFIETDKLAITSSKEALNEILVRLEKQAFIR